MTKETFINTLELLKRQQNLNCGLAQELQITLRRAFPDVYDWILWWLAKPDNFAIWTDDEPQRWNLGDAGSLYNFISGAAVRDPALRGNDTGTGKPATWSAPRRIAMPRSGQSSNSIKNEAVQCGTVSFFIIPAEFH